MNRAAFIASAVRDSLDSNVEEPVPAPTVERSDVAYDLPGDQTVTWSELSPEAATLALASKNPYTWTPEEERAATELLQVTPEPLPEAHIKLLFALGEAEEARLRRDGATSADLDD